MIAKLLSPQLCKSIKPSAIYMFPYTLTMLAIPKNKKIPIKIGQVLLDKY